MSNLHLMKKNPFYPGIPDFAVDSGPYWVKLGEGDKYAEEGIRNGKIYVRWNEVTEKDLTTGNWDSIEEKIRTANRKDDKENKGAATRQFRLFATFCASTEDDIWITFHNAMMYWGRLKKDCPVGFGTVGGEDVKFRDLDGGWSCKSMRQAPLNTNQLPGVLAMLSGMHQTLGAVNSQEFPKRSEILMAVITGEKTETRRGIEDSEALLEASLVPAIKQLHPNDFEILVDLIFRGAGWKRRTVLGSNMKDVDLEVEEPMRRRMTPNTRFSYAIQVKSRASAQELENFRQVCNRLRDEDPTFTEGYLFTHTGYDDLQRGVRNDSVEVVTAPAIAKMVMEFGLVRWLLDRTV